MSDITWKYLKIRNIETLKERKKPLDLDYLEDVFQSHIFY